MKNKERVEVGVGKISSTGSLVIPANIREAEGLKTGDRVQVIDVDGKIYIQKPDVAAIRQFVKELEKVGSV